CRASGLASTSSAWRVPARCRPWRKCVPACVWRASCRSSAPSVRATSAGAIASWPAARARRPPSNRGPAMATEEQRASDEAARPVLAREASRWWTYQRERFPVLAHGPLIAAFSLSAVSFSSLLRGRTELPDAKTAVVAFATSFLFFLQLRLADEFKDFEED